MKRITKLLSLFTLPAMFLGIVGCNRTYTDMAERPEITTPAPTKTVVYPTKPDQKPVAEQGVAPTIAGYTASATEKTYVVNKTTNGATVSYKSLSDWSYVYIPITNYTAAYGNVKISLTNGVALDPENPDYKPVAERIAVQAVYYEAYELGYAPVTVFLGELTEGEQYVIFELGEYSITDKNYAPVTGESVKNKTLLGFVVFIDSLPSYKPLTDGEGALEITKFEMLQDNDPKLEDRYVKPVIDFASASADTGVTVTPSVTETQSSLAINGTGKAYLPVTKYSSDYAKIKLTLNGTEGETAQIGVRYTLDGGKTKLLSLSNAITLTGSSQDAEYNYFDKFAEGATDDIKTQYVKHGLVTDICVVAAGEVTVEKAAFERTAKDGAYVLNVWSPSTNIEIGRAQNGGNARIDYKYHDGWTDSISVPVRKGERIEKITLKIQAPEGLAHLGVGVGTTSNLGTNNQDAGRYILRPARHKFKISGDTIKSEVVNEEVEPNLNGMKELLAYDAASKTYTITYDFTAMKDTAGKSLADYTISSLLFYLTCPCAGTEKKAHTFEGKRSLYFLSIELTQRPKSAPQS